MSKATAAAVSIATLADQATALIEREQTARQRFEQARAAYRTAVVDRIHKIGEALSHAYGNQIEMVYDSSGGIEVKKTAGESGRPGEVAVSIDTIFCNGYETEVGHRAEDSATVTVYHGSSYITPTLRELNYKFEGHAGLGLAGKREAKAAQYEEARNGLDARSIQDLTAHTVEGLARKGVLPLSGTHSLIERLAVEATRKIKHEQEGEARLAAARSKYHADVVEQVKGIGAVLAHNYGDQIKVDFDPAFNGSVTIDRGREERLVTFAIYFEEDYNGQRVAGIDKTSIDVYSGTLSSYEALGRHDEKSPLPNSNGTGYGPELHAKAAQYKARARLSPEAVAYLTRAAVKGLTDKKLQPKAQGGAAPLASPEPK
ncbi:MAG: hypothetical protein HY053_04810 [Proteobacteria bacterium]|nr:hypothetical protein [Pseudomonadota bacterium]